MTQYDIYGIGNALLDVEYDAADEFLSYHSIEKGRMTLVDSERMNDLLNAIGGEPSKMSSGGSAANTIFASQGFGCKNFFAGRVADDATGEAFVNEMRTAGIGVNDPIANSPDRSGQCVIFVTDDGERSMNTCLGISHYLNVDDVREKAISTSKWVFIEGYLASSPTGSEAAKTVRQIAQSANVSTSITLSDVAIVRSFRPALESMLGNNVDVMFCNVEEALAWSETDSLETAIHRILECSKCAIVTVSQEGAYVVTRDNRTLVPGFGVNVVDSNGAGDMYAGAFLTASIRGNTLERCARFANYAASQIVIQYGARLATTEEYRLIIKNFVR